MLANLLNLPVKVLILVLVEDVGGQMAGRSEQAYSAMGLNPCFGGRCGGTESPHWEVVLYIWNSLNPCFGGRCGGTKQEEKL